MRDLDAAAALYRRLGFQVGARNRHPPAWGTQNHIVQFPGIFVELLTVADPTHIAPHAPRFFSFGAFNRDFLARGAGALHAGAGGPRRAGRGRSSAPPASAISSSTNSSARAGAPTAPPIKVAFSLAFARDPKAPDIGFFTCQQRHPENFWNPAFQDHANTAAAVAGVVLVAENPSDHHIFLSAFTGERELLATSAGITVKTPRGEIQVMTPAAFRDHFGVAPPRRRARRTARGAALCACATSATATAVHARGGNCRDTSAWAALIVGPTSRMGATLVFEPACSAAG